MPAHLRPLIASALLTLMLPACRQPSTQNPQVEAFRHWCEQSARSGCERSIRCGLLAPERRGDCESTLQRPCDDERILDGLRDGRMSFDDDAAWRCVAKTREWRCDDVEPCDRALKGSVPVGGACAYGFDCEEGAWCGGTGCARTCRAGGGVQLVQGCGASVCEEGSYCRYTSDADGQPIFSCVARDPLGAPCTYGTRCVAGAFCDPLQWRCTPVRAEGEACQGHDACTAGTFCDPRGPSPFVCRALQGAGVPCDWPGMCRDGLTCRRASAAAERVCAEPAREEEYCESAGDCRSGSDCEVRSNLCRGRARQLGEPCDANTYCEGFAWCDRHSDDAPGTCARPLGRGEPCARRGNFVQPLCVLGLQCGPSSQVCEPLPGDGEACEFWCQQSFVCSDAGCVTPPRAGEPCAIKTVNTPDGLRRSQGACAPLARCEPATARCVRLGEPGEPCSHDAHCRLEACEGGVCAGVCL
ncbi:MAG: hypothetical protein ACK4N5_11085 [Myxococcales bacterium]